LGQRIRSIRESAGLSQEDLARKLGYSSPATISYYEAGGRRISIADLQQISIILGLPLPYFLEEQLESRSIPHFTLRATEVRPSARRFVDAFLYFGQKHAGQRASLPDDISSW